MRSPEKRVVITGAGVVSPFGNGVECYWQNLLAGKHAWRPIRRFDASIYRSTLGAEVPDAVYKDQAARAACGNPAEDATYYLMLAAAQALEDAGMPPVCTQEERVGCVIGTLGASTDTIVARGKAYLTAGEVPPSAQPRAGLVHYSLEYLCERLNLTGPSSLISTACASSTDALGYAYDLVATGECHFALAGGSDILSELIHSGFNALFSITLQTPKPFDVHRDGFVIGEGAGLVVLESLASAQARGASIYAEILGYGLSNTAHHLTATSEDGAGEALAISRALADAQLEPQAITYINTHGTATTYNDATEIQAIAQVFGEHTPSLSINSIKPAIGHCMGASGIMEAIATVLAIRDGCIPPTLFTKGDEPLLTAKLVTESVMHMPIPYAISQSFGFGGACSCVVLAQNPLTSALHV